MGSRPALVRLKDFEIRQHRREIDQLHIMIADIELLAQTLDREILAEEDQTGMHDPAHFAYPTLAKASNQRRDNLRQSADRLKIQLDDAKTALRNVSEESSDSDDLTPEQSHSIGLERSEQADNLNRAS